MEPLFTITVNGKTFNVYTLPSYNTPYYYVVEYGALNHFQTVLRLKNYIKRRMTGKTR